jgi:C4-dicarboxylate-specific signal transduction histidine kinase
MSERTEAKRATAVAVPRILSQHRVIVGLLYIAGYVLLDWISLIEPYAPFGISPWNPGTGLSFALVLLFGRQMIPVLFAGVLVSDLVHRPLPLPWPVELSAALLIAGGYAAALLALMHPRVRFDPALSSMRDLILFLLVAVVSAAVVASGYVALAVAAGQLPAADFVSAALRYWVGDVIGIIVVTPFTLYALTRRRLLPMSLETALQLAAILAALALVLGYADERQLQLFYVLLLPIVWMAVRSGSEGVTVGILVTQFGLIVGFILFPEEARDVTAFQALMLILAATGLVAGELVTERRRTEAQLRLQQDSLSRLARLGSMGELAAAIAHELNQPLMAAGTYTRIVNDAIAAGDADAATVRQTAQKAVAQVERAAEVVRRLRALVRLDRSNRAPVGVERIVRETLALCQPDLDSIRADARVVVAPDLPPVMVDLLQIEQALLNLARNSIEAIGATGEAGIITIEAVPGDADFVEMRISDTGPGFPSDLADGAFLPLSSTKTEGLGFGLPLCKSIIEAHGGRLWLGGQAHGAAVHFTLPAAKAARH